MSVLHEVQARLPCNDLSSETQTKMATDLYKFCNSHQGTGQLGLKLCYSAKWAQHVTFHSKLQHDAQLGWPWFPQWSFRFTFDFCSPHLRMSFVQQICSDFSDCALSRRHSGQKVTRVLAAKVTFQADSKSCKNNSDFGGSWMSMVYVRIFNATSATAGSIIGCSLHAVTSWHTRPNLGDFVELLLLRLWV